MKKALSPFGESAWSADSRPKTKHVPYFSLKYLQEVIKCNGTALFSTYF